MPRCPSCGRRLLAASPCPRDGLILEPPDRSLARAAEARDPKLKAPPRAPGFVVRELLGEGGFAQVFAADREGSGDLGEARARTRDLGRVALKIGRFDAPHLLERFRREASALALVGPPFTPALYASGRLDDGRPFIAMERLVGETLADRLASLPEPLDAEGGARVGDAILAALAAAHERGVIHRDLKPENVFFPRTGADTGAGTDTDERAVLLDFGLTKAVADRSDHDSGLTREGVAVGTPEYMAPEQIRAEPDVGAAADIYAFGVILFELITLRLPFQGDSASIEHGHLALRPPRPSEIAPRSAALDELVLACLSKDPARRPTSAAELRRSLASLFRSTAKSPREASSDTTSPDVGLPPSSAAAADAKRSKMITDGRHPVVVLAAESRSAAAPIVAAITAHGGFVVRQRGSRYICTFSGMDVNEPASAALAAARELEARFGARAALHLDSVTLRRKERKPPTVYGACVDKPETWMPPDPWSGILLTSALARVVPAGDLASSASIDPSAVAFVTAASAPSKTDPSAEVELPMLGRDDVIAAIEESASSALCGGAPGLFTLIGDHGLGKSRLAAFAATASSRLAPNTLVIALKASPNVGGALAARETRDLLRRALDAPSQRPPDIQAFCVDRLGPELGPSVAPSVAEALGWCDQGTVPLAHATFHHGIVRALAEALRRKARSRSPIAVILDDASWADDAVLDALEYATLDGSGCPLWVMIAAHPRFEQSRKGWGTRTQSHARAALAPLDEASTADLAARLLLPAEYPPAATLKRLADWSGGNPFSLREIIRDLKRSGIVRRRTYAGTYYVATAELDSLPPSPAWQWLAARQLEALPAELAAFARLCAVLGVSFTRTELERVQDAIDRAGDAGTPVDVGYGIGALVDRKILKRDAGAGERCSFQNALFQDAVYEMMDATQRERAHRRAFEAWRSQVGPESRDVDALSRLARHAGACGERDVAAEAYLRLGDVAFAKHNHVEADQRYTAALCSAREDDSRRRALALAGRGTCRYRVHRIHEALNDLESARDLFQQLRDDESLVNALLEEATALDWAREFERSASFVAEARVIAVRLGTSHPTHRLLIAEGRTQIRRGQMAQAVESLEQGCAHARRVSDYQTQIVGVLLLSFALVCTGQTGEAERRFQEAIELASGVKDLPHLCVAYLNRVSLWVSKKCLEMALEDLRKAIELTRETGNPLLEGAATYNVAELLYWSDHRDEALELARRAHVLESRFSEKPVPFCSLLLARLLVAASRYDEAKAHVEWISQSCPPEAPTPSTAAFLEMLKLLIAGRTKSDRESSEEAPRWDALLETSRHGLIADEMVEIHHWYTHAALEGGDLTRAARALEGSRSLVSECPTWQARFELLARRLAEMQARASDT